MITPPFNTKARYALNLQGVLAHAALSNLITLPEIIDQVYIMSKTDGTDIEMTNEVLEAMTKITAEEEVECSVSFNPLYVPHDKPIEDLEYNNEGDIISIGGFPNPYTTVAFQAVTESKILARGGVSFEEFELPELSSVLAPSESKVN